MDLSTNTLSTVSREKTGTIPLSDGGVSHQLTITAIDSAESLNKPQSIPVTSTLTNSEYATLPHTSSSPLISLSDKPLSQLAVIIPTFNNELTIGTLVILTKKYAANVVVIDDGSTDRTVEVAECAGADVINARLYGGGRVQSILAGCKLALGYDCKAVILIDSGGEHLTREIPCLAQPVLDGEADLVIGSRYLSGRKAILPYQLNTTASSFALPQNRKTVSCTDPDSTFRAISVRGICLLDLLPNSDSFEPMMVSLFSRKGLSIREVPIVLRHDLADIDRNKLQMYKEKKVAVVMPAHNEELLIGETLRGIPDFVTHIYVVNDCSTDRTQEVVDYYASQDSSIIPLMHETNKGAGAAISTGYLKALEDGMDIVATMDGDNQMDPSFLPLLLDPIIEGKCDFTMGNRLINSEYRKGMSSWRFFGNAILTILTKIASGYWSMVDPQNGYTAVSKRALEKIDVSSMYPKYGYLNDRLVRLNIWGFRVINVPHPARYGKEKSGIKYSTYIFRVSWLLLKDFLWRLEIKYVVLSFHPLVFFYATGIVFTILSLILGIYSLYWKFVVDNAIFFPGIMTLILLSLGLQGIFFAMFFDMQQEKANNGWYA